MDPLQITGVVTDEVTEPRDDGSAGSALYAVPIGLNRSPDAIERELLGRHWDRPSSWTSMHRPGILRISGDRLVLNGTTIEEVERYHARTLSLVVDQTNEEAAQHRARTRQQVESEAAATEEHRSNVAEVAKRIEF